MAATVSRAGQSAGRGSAADADGPPEARSDIILWLSTRLRVTATLRQHPEILDEKIELFDGDRRFAAFGHVHPVRAVGAGPHVGVPLMWEALQPCPPPEAATYTSDLRIKQADDLFTQWKLQRRNLPPCTRCAAIFRRSAVC